MYSQGDIARGSIDPSASLKVQNAAAPSRRVTLQPPDHLGINHLGALIHERPISSIDLPFAFWLSRLAAAQAECNPVGRAAGEPAAPLDSELDQPQQRLLGRRQQLEHKYSPRPE